MLAQWAKPCSAKPSQATHTHRQTQTVRHRQSERNFRRSVWMLKKRSLSFSTRPVTAHVCVCLNECVCVCVCTGGRTRTSCKALPAVCVGVAAGAAKKLTLSCDCWEVLDSVEHKHFYGAVVETSWLKPESDALSACYTQIYICIYKSIRMKNPTKIASI